MNFEAQMLGIKESSSIGVTQLKISEDSKPMPNKIRKTWQEKHAKATQCKHTLGRFFEFFLGPKI